MKTARTQANGRKAAIEAHCRECIYDDQAPGTWRQQVALCSVTACALYRYRPASPRPIPEIVLRYFGVKAESCLAAAQMPRKTLNLSTVGYAAAPRADSSSGGPQNG